jgi:hypothetical protein
MRLHRSWFVTAALVAVPVFALAQRGNLTNQQPATQDAAVDFGVLPTAPLGPAPCLQTGAIGGPADPCQYMLHHLTPEEVFIKKEGEVTFQIHGGGHGFAIYEVSKDTTRNEIGQFLCPGDDPATFSGPEVHPCLPTEPTEGIANAAAQHIIRDGDNDVVIVAAPNITNAHPDNRVWSPPGRLMSAGGRQFLNGGTIPAGATSDGQLITYRFLKNGRYLVICMNRSHFLNDWMFGFVNVQ